MGNVARSRIADSDLAAKSSNFRGREFSAVSRPIFATKYLFFRILRDLEDMQSFAPLRSQNSSKKSAKNFVVKLFSNFCKKSQCFGILRFKHFILRTYFVRGSNVARGTTSRITVDFGQLPAHVIRAHDGTINWV